MAIDGASTFAIALKTKETYDASATSAIDVVENVSLGSTTVWNGTEPHVEVLGAMMKDEYQKKYGEKWEAPLAA